MKARLTIIWTDEYEINPEVYPDGFPPNVCLACDVVDAQNDPYPFMKHGGTFTVNGELIKEGE